MASAIGRGMRRAWATTPGPGRRLECPLCGARLRRFLPGPGGRQPRARCPQCGSLQRHRLLWLVLDRVERVGETPRDVLHLAPEAGLAGALQGLPEVRWTGADLDPAPGLVRADLEALPFEDGAFDLVIANHVLEHVGDDARAFAEVRRVLRPGGAAILQVPVNGPVTREDPAATPEERLRLHGQEDHVRTYGRDVVDRVARSGLVPSWLDAREHVTADDRRRYGLDYAPDFGIDLGELPEAWEIHLYRKA